MVGLHVADGAGDVAAVARAGRRPRRGRRRRRPRRRPRPPRGRHAVLRAPSHSGSRAVATSGTGAPVVAVTGGDRLDAVARAEHAAPHLGAPPASARPSQRTTPGGVARAHALAAAAVVGARSTPGRRCAHAVDEQDAAGARRPAPGAIGAQSAGGRLDRRRRPRRRTRPDVAARPARRTRAPTSRPRTSWRPLTPARSSTPPRSRLDPLDDGRRRRPCAPRSAPAAARPARARG